MSSELIERKMDDEESQKILAFDSWWKHVQMETEM